MVSPFQFAVRMSRAEEGLRGLWLTQDGCGFGTVGDGETPLDWMGTLHEGSRLIHGAADEAWLSSPGGETKPPLKAKPAGTMLTPGIKTGICLWKDLSGLATGPAQTCLRQRLGKITSAQVDTTEYSALRWGWPCVCA